VPGFAGEVWLDLGAATLLGIGVPAPSTPVSVTIPTPQDAALVGMRSAWQAASWSSGYGAQLSNASTYVHRL
jgi:hypothetical protein